MEIESIIYKAKDGRIFYDPLECEDYEKTIGILGGSVGDLILQLEKNTKREYYIFGIVKVQNGEKSALYARWTACIDYLLEDYVNVEELSEEKRYETATIGELIDTIKKLDKDLPCQYFIIFADNVRFKNAGCIANNNPKAWNAETIK